MNQVILKDTDILEVVVKDGPAPYSMVTIHNVNGKLLIKRRALADPKNIQYVLFREE